MNNTAVSVDYEIKNGDKIKHRVHLHEPSVMDTPVEVFLIFFDDFG